MKRILSMILVLVLLIGMVPVTTRAANAVSITSQPKSATVAEGQKATVTVGATGDGLTYTWYYLNKGESTYLKTTSFTGPTYSVVMNAERDGRKVICLVKDKYGNSVKTAAATLSMASAGVKITTQPKSVAVAEGQKATVTVGAAGEGLTYTWYYLNKGESTYLKTTSFTGPTYSVVMNAERDGRKVICLVKDKYGNTIKTTPATLGMTAGVKITDQPASVTVAEGQKATVTVGATGEGLTYTWYYLNKGESTYLKTTSFTGPTYSVVMNAERDGRKVICLVKDKYGNSVKTAPATLSMFTGLTIVQQPQDICMRDGEDGLISLKVAGGKEPYHYSWGYCTGDYDEFFYSDYFSDAPELPLEYDNDLFKYEYRFRCVVTDATGASVTSDVAYVYPAEPFIYVQPEHVFGQLGDTLETKLQAAGPELTYQWYYKDKSASGFTLTNTFKGPSYKIQLTAAREDRQVYCVVTDKFGNSTRSKTVTLTTPKPLQIFDQPSVVYGKPDSYVYVDVDIFGGKAPLSYSWQSMDDDSSSWYSETSSKTLSDYVYDDDFFDHKLYRLTVTDADGNKVTSAPIALKPLIPIIEADLTHVYGKLGETVTATVEVFGENLTYQWYFKDKGADKFTLTNSFKGNTYSVAMTEARDGRQIYCVITSDRGKSVQSKTVILSTPQPLQILEQTPVDLYTHYGAYVELFVEAFGGTPPYDYRWEYHSDEMEAGQWKYWESGASDAFSVYAYHLYENYSFRCIITDADGKQVTSDVIRLRPDRPGIYEGPDADDAYVELGAPINLQVLAYGENLTYQWYVKAADAETFVADPANTGNLYATTLTAANVNSQVYCVITDSNGETVRTDVISLVRYLKVAYQPGDKMLPIGETVTIFGDAVYGFGGYTYEWRKTRNSDVSNYTVLSEGEKFAGVRTNKLSITVTDVSDYDYNYYLKIQDSEGNYIYTRMVRLYESAVGETDVLGVNYDTFISQPTGTKCDPYGSVDVSMEIDGRSSEPPYTFQWQIREENGWVPLALEDGLFMQEESIRGLVMLSHRADSTIKDYYDKPLRCVASDVYGELTVSDSFKLGFAFKIVQQPADNIVNNYFNYNYRSYRIEVTGGQAPYTFLWYDGYQYVKEETTDRPYSTYMTSEPVHWMAEYSCTVKDAVGNVVYSRRANLATSSQIALHTQPTDSTARHGETVYFTVNPSVGNYPFAYQWQYWTDTNQEWRNLDNVSWAEGEGTHTLSFVVAQADLEYDYRYRCIVTDKDGHSLTTREIRFVDPLKVTQQPQSVKLTAGETATFTVAAAGARGEYAYQWEYSYNGGEDWDDADSSGMSGNTTSTLSVKVSESMADYLFRCVITDAGGLTVTTKEVSIA